MAEKKLKNTFALSASVVMSVSELGALLDLPRALPHLIKNFRAHDLVTKTGLEPGESEVLKFVPENYPPLADGRVLDCKDFWLQVALRMHPEKDNVILGLKFTDLGDQQYDVSMPLRADITRDFKYRACFGHHVIERFQGLVDKVSAQNSARPGQKPSPSSPKAP